MQQNNTCSLNFLMKFVLLLSVYLVYIPDTYAIGIESGTTNSTTQQTATKHTESMASNTQHNSHTSIAPTIPHPNSFKPHKTMSSPKPPHTFNHVSHKHQAAVSSNIIPSTHITQSEVPPVIATNHSTDVSIPSDMVVLNFENVNIQSVIKAISQLSGKNFVIDPRVKGTVNIVSDKPIPKADSYKVLEAALRMQGFACVETDGVINVLPEVEAKTYGAPMDTATDKDFSALSKQPHQIGDQMVTKIFIIKHGSATQLSNAIRPLIAPNNSISVYSSDNALIITDYASNINRITQIVSQLSSAPSTVEEPVVITLQNAVAADVAQILHSYLGTGGSGGGSSGGGSASEGPSATITVDAANNSLIIYSAVKDKIDELKALALQIDKNIGATHDNLHVVYLKNADANHIADVLRAVINEQENPDLTASSKQAKFATEPTSTFGSTGSSGSGGGSSGGSGMSSAMSSMSSSSSRPSGGNNSNQKDAPKVFVQAEPTTNSLIIEAPQAVYRNLRMIIDMLDVRRAQVMIEALIADINTTEEGAFGIQWVLGGGGNNAGVIGLTNYGGTAPGQSTGSSLTGLATSVMGATAAANPAAMAAGGGMGTPGLSLPNEVFVGLVTGTTSYGGTPVPSLAALSDMITANSIGNVLSRPTMITLDNEEARIMVGSNVGIPNGSFQNTGALAGGQVTTITRQDLGTVLQIKPLITQNGAIQLDIYQEDSQLDPNQAVNSANGPSFLKRNMRATILVDDGQIIALGGMTQDTIQIQQNGIPLLCDIPYLGWLFSWQSRVHTKTNLVLFLRPVIIKNADGYKALTNERYRYIVGEQELASAKGTAMLPGIKPVTLDNQVPYHDGPLPGQSHPSLNMNQNVPIVDLTHGGANIGRSSESALSVTSTRIMPGSSTSMGSLNTPIAATTSSTMNRSALGSE